MKHLEQKNIQYWKHWWIATRAGIALLVHAWFPNILEEYASNLICPNNNK